ncbi:MAG: ACP phosphodiesterase [Myxococcales bacterium]|nr:ACP phosphodiesterase [Myxococcales bacterium]|tara:strand:+ start:1107 stop:1697 length:591 start_codon:yes stop_codon:yes gene_type:complete
MNYLAHFHIARETQTSLVGAMLGDFVKGSRYKDYAPDLQTAIRLHRRIDAYTEDSPLIRDAKKMFDPNVRRFAGIALDVFWDHCLAKNFAAYDAVPLADFVHEIYGTLQADTQADNPHFERVSYFMMTYDWLNSYAHVDGLTRALQGLSRRRPALAPVADCIPGLASHGPALEKMFEEFYPHLVVQSREWVAAGFA